jgi:hypothetical protein
MGQVVRKLSPTTTRYYWYPGEKKEWLRAAVAIGLGGLVLGIMVMATGDLFVSVICGTASTAATGGFNFGRRDARAIAGMPDFADRKTRRAAFAHTGRAAWRGTMEGIAEAGFAVLIANMPPDGFLNNWVLPLIPAVVGTLAHQTGAMWERASVSTALSADDPAAAADEEEDETKTLEVHPRPA